MKISQKDDLLIVLSRCAGHILIILPFFGEKKLKLYDDNLLEKTELVMRKNENFMLLL